MLYDEMLPKAWTTVYMPEWTGALGEEVILKTNLLTLPFPVVHFIEPFFYSPENYTTASDEFFASKKIPRAQVMALFPHGIRGVDHFVMWNDASDPLKLCCASKCMWGQAARELPPLYGPEHPNLRTSEFAATLQRFNLYLADRTARFKTQSVSRQVRRYHGFAEHYNEVVIMRKETTPRDQFAGGMSMRKLMPTLIKAHPVRSHTRAEHLRTLRNGEIMVVPQTVVRAYVRGKGDAVQVKDYKLA